MSECKLRPLADRVIVKLNEADKVSPGGILLPESVKEKPAKGTIVSAGPGKACGLDLTSREPLDVKVGDVVIFGAYSGHAIPGDDAHVILRADDIFAVEV